MYLQVRRDEMAMTTTELQEVSQAIRAHNSDSNPFTCEKFSFDQIRVLADVLFGKEASLAKENWIDGCAQ